MTPETSVSIALLISVLSIVCTLINTFAGGKKRQQEQIEAEKNRQLEIEKNFVKINVKLDEFCETLRSLMAENVKKTEELKEISERLVAVSEQVKTLFSSRDNHEKRIKTLEDKVK